MKILWITGVAWTLLTLQIVLADDKEDDYCNQQLIQASVSCVNLKTLESCISKNLVNAGCEIEIVAEEDINVCNEECAPDLTALLTNEIANEKKNILSLTEGE